MKIESIRVYPIRSPRKEVARSGVVPGGFSASEFGIGCIDCEGGYTGLGEISVTYPQIGFSLCYAARTLIAPALIGQDALAIPKLLAILDRLLVGELSSCYLRAAFEMALLDLSIHHLQWLRLVPTHPLRFQAANIPLSSLVSAAD